MQFFCMQIEVGVGCEQEQLALGARPDYEIYFTPPFSYAKAR
jgi:hypothetical protein